MLPCVDNNGSIAMKYYKWMLSRVSDRMLTNGVFECKMLCFRGHQRNSQLFVECIMLNVTMIPNCLKI